MGESGLNSHVEGIVTYDTEHTANVTTRIKRLYDSMDLEVSPNSIRVKKASELVGAIIYANKELKTTGTLIILQGWKQSWIDQQVKDNVKKIPYKMLLKKGTRLSQNTAPAVIYEYCLANNLTVHSKFDLIEVMRKMGDERFLGGSTKPKGVLADVMSLFGDGRGLAAFYENELRFVE